MTVDWIIKFHIHCDLEGCEVEEYVDTHPVRFVGETIEIDGDWHLHVTFSENYTFCSEDHREQWIAQDIARREKYRR